MRFLSDDNKVFNTLEECEEHENRIKDSQKNKERKEELHLLMNRYDKICNDIDEWDRDIKDYQIKWANHIAKEVDVKEKQDDEEDGNEGIHVSLADLDYHKLINFLSYLFEEEE